MNTREREVLVLLKETHDSGSFALACDGDMRAPAHKLDKAGFAQWHGESWGSSFWSITENGLKELARGT